MSEPLTVTDPDPTQVLDRPERYPDHHGMAVARKRGAHGKMLWVASTSQDPRERMDMEQQLREAGFLVLDQSRYDALTRRMSSFKSFAELVIDPGGVVGTRHRLDAHGDTRGASMLADMYDLLQHARGDARRILREW